MNPQARDNLRAITNFDSLIDYLRDELDWPIEETDFEDLTFDYGPEELGIDEKNAAKIDPPIKQLRPLSGNQPWGIFFVKFEPKRLPVVALRRILSRLVLRKRSRAEQAEQASWQLHDLLFILNFGEAEQRQITFAHFSDTPGTGDLPTLQVLGWDAGDTALHLDHVDDELHQKMRWPDDESDLETWRERWSAAFTLRHREVVTTSKKLAVELAKTAQRIRRRVNAVLAIEDENGAVRKLMASFKEALIHDLSEDDFADMYAQTISYGLLSTRVSRPAGLVADDLVHMAPVTNPFLKELLETFLNISGRKKFLDFDELGVNEVVHLLREANMEAVLRDFGDANPQEDPVIHFYELFLKEYDAKRRMQRGVFYTPRPVVSFIVRSVDEILRTEFGLADGLADTATWGEMARCHQELQIPKGADPEQCFVQILDPATGTGTFLVEVIDLIHKTLTAKWRKQGKTAAEIKQLWNDYVPKYLLPRLHGYELLMAPYAIAHMKIGLKLAETGYHFCSAERVRVYLTNALEPAQDFSDRLAFAVPALAHEAEAVNGIKDNQRFTVVIGNPPYAGISSNMTEHAQRIVDAYKVVDGEALKERKLWLQDDYVKFIRNAQTIVEEATAGVLGYISNHGYLDNPTFRGMRQSIMGTFQRVRLIDLHGNANKKEQSPDGSEDKNVFDIRQGVAICLAARGNLKPLVQHADLWGTRESKYAWLVAQSSQNAHFTLVAPDSPYYFYKKQDTDYRSEYNKGWKINEAMPVNSAGFITARDHFVIDFRTDALLKRIADFADPSLTDTEIRRKYFVGRGADKYLDGDTRGWKVPEARQRVRIDKRWCDRVRPCLYRPFDERMVYWVDWMIDWPRPEVMGHMLAEENVCLHVCRQSISVTWGHVLASNGLTDDCYVSNKTRERGYTHPLYLYARSGGLDLALGQEPNFSRKFLKELAERLGLEHEPLYGLPKAVTPENIFHYAYSVFHSPGYRNCYAEFLKIDFPRLPLTASLELFRALAKLGGELVALHLMESPRLENFITTLVGPKPCEGFKPSQGYRVEKVSYSAETVWLDKAQTTGFRGVTEEVWNFHIGGYQVCEKWLKDRQAKGGKNPRPGRVLTPEDLAHYQKIVVALKETIRLMQEIDEVIDKHGGWPGAFVSK